MTIVMFQDCNSMQHLLLFYQQPTYERGINEKY